MSSPKEKAKELVEKFLSPTKVYHEHLGWVNYLDSAKECALIAVDEILNNFGLTTNGQTFFTEHRAVQFYQEVKQEISKL